MQLTTRKLVAAGVIASATATSFGVSAQETIGFDDFNTAVAGTDFVSRVFSPDNSSSTGFGGLDSPTFGGSNFDLFGIARRDTDVGTATETNGEPFDVFDESLTTFPPDVIGFNSIGTDGFVVASDTDNGNNPGGLVQLDYVFDVSGYENIQVSIDWAAFGNFETAEGFNVTAGLNGGTQNTIIEIGLPEALDDQDILYTSTLASGTVSDIFFDPFFEQDDHDFLIANAADIQANGAQTNPATGNLVDFHIDDTDFDGRIDVPTALDPLNTTEAVNSNGFENQELQPYQDPLFASTDGFLTTTQLDNTLTTITADVTGVGDTLELSFVGLLNGSVEYVIFDNIEITGDLIDGGPQLLLGDADGDGDVDAFDVTAVEQNFGNTGLADGSLLGDADGDGDVDAFDVTAVEQNFGNTLTFSSLGTLSSVTAVPEPTSLALLGLGGLLIARRRRA